MFQHNEATPRIICAVLALLLFGIAGFAWPVPVEPYRLKIVAIGLFFLTLSTFF